MFKKILFATTASPACNAAAKIAFELAEKYKPELWILHVLAEPSRSSAFSTPRGGDASRKKIRPEQVQDVTNDIYAVYEDLIKKHGVPKIEAAIGRPAAEILKSARDRGADLIVMGAHTRTDGPGSARFRGVSGSTLQQVTQKAPCPVLVVNRPCETCFWYFNKIIFGTDFSKPAMAAFEFAYGMAQAIGCKLYLFHAPDVGPNEAGLSPDQKTIEDRVKEAGRRMETEYVSRMNDFDNYEIAVWEGIPYVELLKFAREISADLIVTAHHAGDKNPGQALLGSTVEQVVLRSACPVITINHTPSNQNKAKRLN